MGHNRMVYLPFFVSWWCMRLMSFIDPLLTFYTTPFLLKATGDRGFFYLEDADDRSVYSISQYIIYT